MKHLEVVGSAEEQMAHVRDKRSVRLEELNAICALLEFAKSRAQELNADELVQAIDEAKDVALSQRRNLKN